MNSSTTTSRLPAAYATADVRHLAPTLGARLRRAGLAVWRVLEEAGRLRALRELDKMAGRWGTDDPERAREMRGASRFLMGAPHR